LNQPVGDLQGIDEAVQLMKLGSVWKLSIPGTAGRHPECLHR
jgi:FKBP-type peptidyl-prolyl cis-trans isomerase